jgi:hypothetical protein
MADCVLKRLAQLAKYISILVQLTKHIEGTRI